jgi:DNA processing protein
VSESDHQRGGEAHAGALPACPHGTSAGCGECADAPGACAACARRSWLLGALGGPLEYVSRDRARLFDTLALADDELLKALAGRRAEKLRAAYAAFPRSSAETGAREAAATPEARRICRHRRGYPRALSGRSAPHMLEVSGRARRLVELASAPAVAIVGASAASDYGVAVAASIARGLAASGVTVVASLADGIAVAAHAGALEAGAGSVAVMGGGLRVACPARRRSLYERVTARGCAVSELPADCDGRRWGGLACERIVVELAAATVLVEARDTPGELAGARLAGALGRVVAAVPGRVSSPLARGPHALIADGARLVRGAHDVLELLASAGGGPTPPRSDTPMLAFAPAGTAPGMSASLARTLERVGAGADTPGRLARAGEDPREVLFALSELEAMGLLARGDGGRYVPRDL